MEKSIGVTRQIWQLMYVCEQDINYAEKYQNIRHKAIPVDCNRSEGGAASFASPWFILSNLSFKKTFNGLLMDVNVEGAERQ